MEFYLLIVEGAVEPSLEGPFQSEEQQLLAAKEIFPTLNGSNCDNIFRLRVENNKPYISAFISGELDE